MMNISPDTEQLLEAISIINKNGASLCPDDIEASVTQTLKNIGIDAVTMCFGKTYKEKQAFILGYALAIKK